MSIEYENPCVYILINVQYFNSDRINLFDWSKEKREE